MATPVGWNASSRCWNWKALPWADMKWAWAHFKCLRQYPPYRSRPSSVICSVAAGVMLHDAFFFTLPIFIACGVALIMQLFAAPKPKIELDAPLLVMQVHRPQGIATLFLLEIGRASCRERGGQN